MGSSELRAIFTLLDQPQKSISEVSDKMGISEERIEDSIKKLEEMGLVTKTANGFEKKSQHIIFSDEENEPQSVLDEHKNISNQILSKLDPFDLQRVSFYRNGFLSTNLDNIWNFKEEQHRLIVELYEKSDKDSKDMVYAFSFSGVNMLKQRQPL